ncbi:S-norcoclaurine synthase [Morus notabilis]|uniref:S-norcoclaurine synthase n=1 Tax=Morus notabilis TaxID=981085 RepID=W9QDC3_9ROSA|nr:S-norcoclaurine synthase [Morus notabilis]EXB29146.1 S-norcoclaurine synthase [Morus notabilis]
MVVGDKLWHKLELPVPASEAWELYGGLQLAKLVEEQFSTLIQKIELVQGDGGLGTILHLSFVPGTGLSDYKEKFTKIDNENRVKETEVVEGGYLDLGFTLYRVRFEIIEKDGDSSIVKSTIEYEVKDEFAVNASVVSIDALANIALLAKNHLTKPKP